MARDPFEGVPEPDFEGVGRRRNAGVEGMAAYEDAAVRKLCALLGRPALARLVADEARDRTERGAISLALFDEMARFPVVLRTGKLRRVRFVTLPDLFNNFARSPIGVGLRNVHDEVGYRDRPIGLVFRWAGIKTDDGKQNTIKGGKFMIAHTATTDLRKGGIKLVARPAQRGWPDAVTVETLESFAASYEGWEPAVRG